MANNNVGRVTQILGAVLDVQFEGDLPFIQNALTTKRANGEQLVLEVAQELGERTVRCIAMDSTDGLARGVRRWLTPAVRSRVPVGRVTLGRIFNLLGEPIDLERGPRSDDTDDAGRSIATPPRSRSLATVRPRCSRPGSR